MNEAQKEAVAQANAYLNNVCLPLYRRMVIEVSVKSVYGNTLIYPANENAKLLAQIAGTKTINNQALALAERMGFSIVTVPDAALAKAVRGVPA